MISDEKVEGVRHFLRQIERDRDVRVIYAVESGSRSYGFASENSDYDVRGIYVRPLDFYTSIDVENKSDTIERQPYEDIDIALWDIRKTLQLMRKSNPHLYEWLRAPVNLLYMKRSPMCLLRNWNLMSEFYSPRRTAFHYYHMSRGNYEKYIKGKDRVRIKKYLYVIRPLLILDMLEYMDDPFLFLSGSFPDITELINCSSHTGMIDSLVKDHILDLVRAKQRGEELGESPPITELNEWVDRHMNHYEDLPSSLPDSNSNVDKLNRVFRMIVAGGI